MHLLFEDLISQIFALRKICICLDSVTPDTLIPNVYDPQSLNRYMFERGNPYGKTDPTGHEPATLTIAIVIVGSLVAILGAVLFFWDVYDGTKTQDERIDMLEKDAAVRIATIGLGQVGGQVSKGLGGNAEVAIDTALEIQEINENSGEALEILEKAEAKKDQTAKITNEADASKKQNGKSPGTTNSATASVKEGSVKTFLKDTKEKLTGFLKSLNPFKNKDNNAGKTPAKKQSKK